MHIKDIAGFCIIFINVWAGEIGKQLVLLWTADSGFCTYISLFFKIVSAESIIPKINILSNNNKK